MTRREPERRRSCSFFDTGKLSLGLLHAAIVLEGDLGDTCCCLRQRSFPSACRKAAQLQPKGDANVPHSVSSSVLAAMRGVGLNAHASRAQVTDKLAAR